MSKEMITWQDTFDEAITYRISEAEDGSYVLESKCEDEDFWRNSPSEDFVTWAGKSLLELILDRKIKISL